MTFDEIATCFQSQLDHQMHVIKQTSAQERIAKLCRLQQAIIQNQDEIKQAMYQDFSKSPTEVDINEIYPTIIEIKHAIKYLKRWMRPQYVSKPFALFGTRSYILYEPRGVVLIIGPWNYPFQLLLCPLVAAIAAGNCVCLKPSELTPYTSVIIHKLISKIFAENEIAVIEGGIPVTQQLLTLPFDHIFFTGSQQVGKIVLENAANHLTSVTLELGGKSPCIIDETVNLKETAERIMWGKFMNAGQTCIAPDYIWIHQSRFDDFIAEAIKVINKFSHYPLDKKSPDFCSIINDRNFERIKQLTGQSLAQGATLITGGIFDSTTRYISLTLLGNIDITMPIMQEEIFGPILPIMTYHSLEKEVFPVLAKQPKPLVLYIFTQNKKQEQTIIANSSAGGTVVNNTILNFVNTSLPFGGVGKSGMGRYHGYFGFQTFSNQRAVLEQGKLNISKLFYPPYTKRVNQLVKWLIRF